MQLHSDILSRWSHLISSNSTPSKSELQSFLALARLGCKDVKMMLFGLQGKVSMCRYLALGCEDGGQGDICCYNVQLGCSIIILA